MPEHQIASAPRDRRFKPFGEVYFESQNTGRRRFYAGHPHQQETGLIYMKARWMNPTTGTFLSVDPVVADYADPLSRALGPRGCRPINPGESRKVQAAESFFGACDRSCHTRAS